MSYTVDELSNSWTVIRDTEGRVVAEMAAGTTPALAHQFAAGPELLEAAEAALVVLKSCCEKAWRDEDDSVCSGECRYCDVHAAKEKLETAIARAKGGEAGE